LLYLLYWLAVLSMPVVLSMPAVLAVLASGGVLETPGAAWAWGGRGSDCGPEPSLRTCPCVILVGALRRLPSDSLGRIDAPRSHPSRHQPLRQLLARGGGASWVLAFLSRVGWGGRSCGAAKIGRAGGLLWRLGVLRRGDDAARW